MTDNLHTTLADILLRHRKAAGLSQLELANLAGVGKTVIFDIEHAKPSIRFDTLLRVLHALNIQITFMTPLKDTARDNQ